MIYSERYKKDQQNQSKKYSSKGRFAFTQVTLRNSVLYASSVVYKKL